MAIKIKQGDAYKIPVEIILNGTVIAIADVERVEFMLGSIRKTYPENVEFDAGSGMFNLPLTQSESLGMPVGAVSLDIRVKFSGGDVQGLERPITIPVVDAVSEQVI